MLDEILPEIVDRAREVFELRGEPEIRRIDTRRYSYSEVSRIELVSEGDTRVVYLKRATVKNTDEDPIKSDIAAEYRILVQASGYAEARIDGNITEDALVTVVLARGGSAVVRVTAGGAPVEGAEVQVFASSGVEIATRITQETMMTGSSRWTTAEDGSVRLGNLPAGTHRLTVVAEDGQKGEAQVKVADGVEAHVAVELR